MNKMVADWKNWINYKADKDVFYDVSFVHDSSAGQGNSVVVSVPRSKGKVDYADIVDENGEKRNQGQVTEDESYASGHYRTTQQYFSSTVASVHGKSSAKITSPYFSGAFMCATIADGKDIGSDNEVDDLTAVNAADFSKALSRVYDVNARTNPSKDSIEILQMSIQGIAVSEPYAKAAQNENNIPSLSSVRNNADGNLEVLVSGKQTAIIAYTDGTYDLISSNKEVNGLRDERNITPSPDKTSEISDTRSYARQGDRLTHVVADPRKVASVIISSDGVIDKLLTSKVIKGGRNGEEPLATVADIIEADGQQLSLFKEQVEALEDMMSAHHNGKTIVKVDVASNPHFNVYEKRRNVQKYPSGSSASQRKNAAERKFEVLPHIEIATPKRPKIEETPVIYMEDDQNKHRFDKAKKYPSGRGAVDGGRQQRATPAVLRQGRGRA